MLELLILLVLRWAWRKLNRPTMGYVSTSHASYTPYMGREHSGTLRYQGDDQ